MSKPWTYAMRCPACGLIMDPNADHLKDIDGNSVCSQACQTELNARPVDVWQGLDSAVAMLDSLRVTEEHP